MVLKHIRIELARDKTHPEGDPRHFYEFTAPIGPDDRLDPEGWAKNRAVCTVVRGAQEEEEEHGHLVHTAKGWMFDYDGEDAEDDEPLFKLDRHVLREGEYLSVTEWDGIQRTFKIVRMTPLVR